MKTLLKSWAKSVCWNWFIYIPVTLFGMVTVYLPILLLDVMESNFFKVWVAVYVVTAIRASLLVTWNTLSTYRIVRFVLMKRLDLSFEDCFDLYTRSGLQKYKPVSEWTREWVAKQLVEDYWDLETEQLSYMMT